MRSDKKIERTPSLDEAVNLFLNMLVARARDGAINDTLSELSEGPPGRKPQQAAVERHNWYSGLDEAARLQVKRVVEEAVDSALFGVLVLLDGAAGGNPLDDRTSDFALSLQTYKDEDARAANDIVEAIRINPPYSIEPLHDRFKGYLEAKRKG